MAVNQITQQLTRTKALIIVAVIAILLIAALVMKPEGGYPGTFWSLVPAILAIVLALITKEVYSSLFVGILFGAILFADFNFEGVLHTVVDGGFLTVLTDSWNVGIILFLVILGIIGVLVLKSGGTKAYGEWALKHIKSRSMAELATFILGVLIFVDDYFNCLTVGQVMRPLTDKFNVSRAKLAYLIDSTAAPICIIAPVSSWAAAVSGSLKDAGVELIGMNAFDLFLQSIPYNFYALFSIVMVITISLIKFDFGPMKKHEDNALNGDLFTTEDRPFKDEEEKINENGHVLDLVIPIFIFLIPACIIALIYTGGFFDGESFIDAFANCDASLGLTYGSLIALLLTIVYMVLRKSTDFQNIMDALPKGFRNMVPPILILVFAWTLCTITKDYLGSAAFVDTLLDNAGSLANFLPAIFMLLACFIAFATGTSWGTMGILLPIVVTTFQVTNPSLMVIGVSACLAGAVFGDHVSPISDTTIMSSAGAQCSHVNHVATQMPYAILVAGMSFIFFLVAGFWQSYLVTLIGIAAMVFVLVAMRQLQVANKLPW
ncbi:MAG: Na+/H+ antiporter NhaC family protein [Candidatus Methanomethylophilaceae archaeon]|nr:Na+/H+ antiporter NhaC family protein [Candidatus Methanomethylophilaceae archaeon]